MLPLPLPFTVDKWNVRFWHLEEQDAAHVSRDAFYWKVKILMCVVYCLPLLDNVCSCLIDGFTLFTSAVWFSCTYVRQFVFPLIRSEWKHIRSIRRALFNLPVVSAAAWNSVSIRSAEREPQLLVFMTSYTKKTYVQFYCLNVLMI